MNALQIGGIYRTQFDDRPFRIIGLDQYEIFYDCLWAEGKWTFSGNFRSKAIFYRMQRQRFEAKSALLDFSPLTEEESRYFRPDLPMRFGRTNSISWNDFTPEKLASAKEAFSKLALPATRLVLVPYGSKGGHRPGVVIENNKSFNYFEILENAQRIQQEVNNMVSAGIGFYRLGYQKGLPSYVIGEYLDRAGTMNELN